jgi:dUTP pyrophosphatase
MVEITVGTHGTGKSPCYAHGSNEDAGADLFLAEDLILYANTPTLAKTGVCISLSSGFEGQIRSRSSLALKRGIQVYNAPGTIDPSYRGEIGVILCWNGFNPTGMVVEDDVEWPMVNKVYREHPTYGKWRGYPEVSKLTAGERIAQLVISQYVSGRFHHVDQWDNATIRGTGGFGSTGA